MSFGSIPSRFLSLAAAVTLVVTSSAHALTGYGVNGNGILFKFDPDAPATSTVVGNLGFVPEAIDFRPGTTTLYAIDVGPNTTQLYTVSTVNGAATPVGPGFNSSGVGYSLTQRVGFDFNPNTLQGDGSIRIRLTDTAGSNLRLNSDTGLIATGGVDLPLLIGTNSPFVDASAYTNTATARAGTGTTTLYAMDSRNDSLYTQNPPNNGTLNLVGPFGVTVDALVGIGFDIFSTDPNDDSLADERAFAVLKRGDTTNPAYLLYRVNLGTGQITNGALVDGGQDFTGGLAIIPEPASLSLLTAALLLRRRR